MKKNKKVVWKLFIIFVLLICTACQEKEVEMTFILPDNEEKFYFLIKKDDAKELEIINGKTTIKFDKTRFLYVKSFKPLNSWHKTKAFEEDEKGNLKVLNDFNELQTVYFGNLELEVVVFSNSPSHDVNKKTFNLGFKEFLKLTDPERLEKMLSDETNTPKKKRPEAPKE